MRVIICFLIVLLAACERAPNESKALDEGSEAVSIYTVNYPLFWAAQQLVGDTAKVYFPAPADVDPAFWEPGLETLAAYQQADMVLLNGASYARWLSRVSLPNNRLLNSAADLTDQLLAMNTGPLHSHGPEGDHSHGELAFTLWLDLSFYAQQIAASAQALSALLPEQTDAIGARGEKLRSRVMAMDAELMELGKKLDGAAVLYSHPVYQYFGRRYQINGRALHWEPDQMPSPQDWQQLDVLLNQSGARLMLWEEQPLPQVQAQLEQRGVQVVVFRPMGNRPGEGDFESGMAANIARLKISTE